MQSQQQLEERAKLARSLGVDEDVDTETAAVLMDKQPQTLRRWACEGSGPIKPRKIAGRLRWRLADIRALNNGETVAA